MRAEATKHEEHCKQHFDSWLAATGACPERRWDRGSEPPDYFLTLRGIRYAVEVSRIIDEERITASASLTKLVDDLEKERLGSGSISGTYSIDPDEPIPKGASYRREFRKQIADYLDETKDEAHPFTRDLVIEGRRVARIEKTLPTGAMLACDGIGGGGWEDEMRQEYAAILGALIPRKNKRLESQAPAVLVLHDALCPIAPHLLRGVVQSIPEALEFEAVYVIRAHTGEVVWNRPSWPFPGDRR